MSIWQLLGLLAFKQCIRSLIVAVPHSSHTDMCWESTWASLPCSMTHNREGQRSLGSVIRCWRTKRTCTWGYVWAEQGKQLLVSPREFPCQRQLRPLSAVDRSQEPTWALLTPNSLSSAFSTSSKGPSAGNIEDTYLKGTNQLRPYLHSFCSSNSTSIRLHLC